MLNDRGALASPALALFVVMLSFVVALENHPLSPTAALLVPSLATLILSVLTVIAFMVFEATSTITRAYVDPPSPLLASRPRRK